MFMFCGVLTHVWACALLIWYTAKVFDDDQFWVSGDIVHLSFSAMMDHSHNTKFCVCFFCFAFIPFYIFSRIIWEKRSFLSNVLLIFCFWLECLLIIGINYASKYIEESWICYDRFFCFLNGILTFFCSFQRAE